MFNSFKKGWHWICRILLIIEDVLISLAMVKITENVSENFKTTKYPENLLNDLFLGKFYRQGIELGGGDST